MESLINAIRSIPEWLSLLKEFKIYNVLYDKALGGKAIRLLNIVLMLMLIMAIGTHWVEVRASLS